MVRFPKIIERLAKESMPKIVQRIGAFRALPKRAIIDESVVCLYARKVDSRIVVKRKFGIFVDTITGRVVLRQDDGHCTLFAPLLDIPSANLSNQPNAIALLAICRRP
jgi:hypothetical protein